MDKVLVILQGANIVATIVPSVAFAVAGIVKLLRDQGYTVAEMKRDALADIQATALVIEQLRKEN